MKLLDRFEAKFIRGDDCWEWTAAKHPFGYGNFWDGKGYTTAHRVSYLLYVGEIPAGICVLHRCDNPACVRPDHLFLGTHQDNIADKIAKGRARGPRMFGEKNPAAKITKGIVRDIRADNRPHRIIAAEKGLGKSQVTRIKSGASWRTA